MLRVLVQGQVQGVGFRSWARVLALRLGLRGYIENLRDGSVEIVAQGTKSGLDSLIETLKTAQPPGSRISNYTILTRYDLTGEDPLYSSFEIK